MTGARHSTIYVKKRAVRVERKAIEARPTKRTFIFAPSNEAAKMNTASGFATSKEVRKPEVSQLRPILAEVQRCLAPCPIAFPRKLWGEVL